MRRYVITWIADGGYGAACEVSCVVRANSAAEARRMQTYPSAYGSRPTAYRVPKKWDHLSDKEVLDRPEPARYTWLMIAGVIGASFAFVFGLGAVLQGLAWLLTALGAGPTGGE